MIALMCETQSSDEDMFLIIVDHHLYHSTKGIGHFLSSIDERNVRPRCLMWSSAVVVGRRINNREVEGSSQSPSATRITS